MVVGEVEGLPEEMGGGEDTSEPVCSCSPRFCEVACTRAV